MLTILTVVGARPQFIKAAPIYRAFAGRIRQVLVHTGQHYDENMSGVFFSELGLPNPDYNLGISDGAHGAMTGRMLAAVEKVLIKEKPDATLVYGDTNSTLAGALAAAKLDIPVIHIEAGLRSFRRSQPEEINRRLTDHIAHLLFCPTKTAVEHLTREGIVKNVFDVGDVMYDAALAAASSPSGRDILDRLGLENKRYRAATIHRAENTNDKASLSRAIAYLKGAGRDDGLPTVFVLHPRTRKACQHFNIPLDGLSTTSPLGYFEMAHLVRNASEVLTDSGGLQKEAYFHHVPCVTLRDETEWTETVDAGWNRLWHDPDFRPRREIHDYGDGHASERIASLSLETLG